MRTRSWSEYSESSIPRENVICRIPIFIGAAVLAKHTDAIATLPLSIATMLAQDLDLQIFKPPMKLPKIDIFQTGTIDLIAIPVVSGFGQYSSLFSANLSIRPKCG